MSVENQPLTPEQLDTLHQTLLEERNRLLRNARHVLSDRINDSDPLPADTIDVSTDESLQATQFRLRDREKYLLRKIDKALQRIHEGDYGHCTECDEPIGFPRLKARPVAELCIDCKEEQERMEGRVAKKRGDDDNSFFSY